MIVAAPLHRGFGPSDELVDFGTVVLSECMASLCALAVEGPRKCWNYALEAIIKMLLLYFLFMIMFIFHARIVLSGNFNTCVVYERHRVPSMPLWTSLLINDG
jgi:hypothetical protein